MKPPSIWIERYRPKVLDDVIFQDERQEKLFKAFVTNQEIPSVLLTGDPGTGKSSISKALIKGLNIDGSDVITVKCSKDKIDAIRNRVEDFSTTLPIGNFKIVRLEELDGMSLDGQLLLRTTIEDSSATCRFIATANYANRIIPSLRKERFQHFEFHKPDKERIAERMIWLLEQEKIEFAPEDLLTYMEVGYPSVRQTIQLLQQNTHQGKLLSPSNSSVKDSDWKFGLLDALNTGNFKLARKIVCESATREEHEDVFRFLYSNIEKVKVKDKDEAIVTIAEYLYKHSIVADTEISLAAMFIELSRL